MLKRLVDVGGKDPPRAPCFSFLQVEAIETREATEAQSLVMWRVLVETCNAPECKKEGKGVLPVESTTHASSRYGRKVNRLLLITDTRGQLS